LPKRLQARRDRGRTVSGSETFKKYATWAVLLKVLIVAFVAGFLVRTMWPARKPARTVVIGEGELNAQGQAVEPQVEPGDGPQAEPQGVAVQVPVPGDGGAVDESMNSIVAQVRPAVIKVIVVPGNGAGTENGIKQGDPYTVSPGQAVGSGVIIDPKGYFLTTNHVVGESSNLQVALYRAGQNQYTARVVARDPDSPLVMGKIRGTTGQTFAYARMGDSDRLRTGDVVMAIGNPFSLSGTVTSGIVSGKRDVNINGTTIQNAIQTDATINDGNAGGPLVNVDGEVVGVSFATYVQGGSFTGIGFAVPINFAKEAWGAIQ
jgi:S1-C subfamily serine protease